MHYVLKAGTKLRCEHCQHETEENIEDYGLHQMGDKTFEHCEECDLPFSITNNDDEKIEFLIDYDDPDIEDHLNEMEQEFDEDYL